MPTTPFAKLLVAVNGGAPTSGGIVAPAAATIQLSAQSTAGWGTNSASPTARWEISKYPVGFACPAGWTADPNGSYFVLSNASPPAFTLQDIAHWGKYKLRLFVDGGLKNGALSVDLEDTTTSLLVLSSHGLRGIVAGEAKEFDANNQWAGEINRDLHTINDGLGGAQAGTILLPVADVDLSNKTLSGTGQSTSSGVPLTNGVHVFLNGQSTPSQNGAWIVQSGAWIRVPEAQAGAHFASAIVIVTTGTSKYFAGSIWGTIVPNSPNDVIGTDGWNVTQIYQFGSRYIAAAGQATLISGTRTFSVGITDYSQAAGDIVKVTRKQAIGTALGQLEIDFATSTTLICNSRSDGSTTQTNDNSIVLFEISRLFGVR